MENDQRNAVNYLSTFSKLIRAILTNSVNTRVKLIDEFQMLRHYVQLEQMRFENKFEFELDVADDLDVENIEIPSMLIQPYVENAILHGLTTKFERGKLKISAQETPEGLLFEIEDDGIGRKAAMQIQEKNTSRHKSFGTTLTEERLKLINSQRNVSYEIIDLEKNGAPAGTKVKIWIGE
jgi:LytS/YehU family sensor histidine kinase